jgi:hypothetical protein
MRGRRSVKVVAALALCLGSLCVIGGVAGAASGMSAAIGMEPAAAQPGGEVEVIGLDFPTGQAVELEVATAAGPALLAIVTVAEGGYFRHPVTLPADAPGGAWELRATAADGTTAVHAFQAGPAQAMVGPVAPRADSAPEATTTQGNSASDIVVMLIIAFLIAAVGGAIAYAWYQTHGALRQPGMGAGDDPIWSNAGDEPIWSAASFDTSR